MEEIDMKPIAMALLAATSLSLGACATGPRESAAYDAPPPSGYQQVSATRCPSTLGSAATGAAVGAAGGAGVGAVVGGINPLEGAIVGAVVGGLAGAIWADSNNDGCVDGYMSNGQYYEGSPDSYRPQQVARRGERG
jgi:phage tail tape-measure protein